MTKNQTTHNYTRSEWLNGLILGAIIGFFGGMLFHALMMWWVTNY